LFVNEIKCEFTTDDFLKACFYDKTLRPTGQEIIWKKEVDIGVPGERNITGFAGIYASGIYTISGISRTGFRNTQNSNFYIYKNNSPSEWRAVEALSNSSFTWYKNLNTNDSTPSVTGWVLYDNVSGQYAPTPETNFGTCNGNTLLTQNHIFELSSFDPKSHGLKFYSGGYINSDGTSNLFPQATKVKNLFTGIQSNTMLRNFYYTEYKNQNRYLLFRGLQNWLIADLSGRYWKSNKNSYFYESGNTILDNATGSYLITGTNANTVSAYIFISINPYFSNQETIQYNPIDLNNYSGIIWLSQDETAESLTNLEFIETGNQTSFSFNNTNLSTIKFSGFYGGEISGNFYSGNGLDYYVNMPEQTPFKLGIYSENTGHFIQWFSAPYSDGPYYKFNLYSGTSLVEKVVTNSTTPIYILTGYLPYSDKYLILSGSGVKNYSIPLNIFISGIRSGYINYTTTSKQISINNFNGFYNYTINTKSGIYSGLKCITGTNYILAGPQFQITGAKSLSSGTNIWSLLDTGFNYTQWKNFESDPLKLPFRYWMSGSGMDENMINLKYIPLYSY
jgi:hypothetical protein